MNEQNMVADVSLSQQNKENDQILVVKNHIYSLLKENKLHVGDRLPSEKALSELLDVPKSAVRDALQSLKSVGLLSSVRGSGYRLTPDFDYSLADILHAMVVHSSASRRDIREVREALEIKELDLIISMGISDEHLNTLKADVDVMMRNRGNEHMTRQDAEDLVYADMEFHRTLAIASDNLFIRAFNIALNEYHDGGKAVKPETVRKRVSDELLDTHKRILDSIIEKNFQPGITALREHYAIGDRTNEPKEGDPVIQTTLFELQKRGFSTEQIMEKLMELK